ncbi:MAG: 3'-5' exonuclease [Alphaproteobacteria bacterium]
MIRPRKLLVFDLETVPDVALARELWGERCEGLDDMAVTQLIWDTMKEQNSSGSEFPRIPFHKIVAIGCLQASIEDMGGAFESYQFERLGCIGEAGDNEEALVKAWFEYGAKMMRAGTPVRLVGFNTRGFDVPTLKMRALKHGVGASWLFQAGDKWSNYNARYDMVWHVDMLDVVSDFGAARGAGKLDEVCVLAGLPGKLDVEGSKVGEMFAAGKVQEIRDYCETDVLNTYLLYLKYQHLTGVLQPSALAAEEARVREWLAGEDKPHLAAFAGAWKRVC